MYSHAVSVDCLVYCNIADNGVALELSITCAGSAFM